MKRTVILPISEVTASQTKRPATAPHESGAKRARDFRPPRRPFPLKVRRGSALEFPHEKAEPVALVFVVFSASFDHREILQRRTERRGFALVRKQSRSSGSNPCLADERKAITLFKKGTGVLVPSAKHTGARRIAGGRAAPRSALSMADQVTIVRNRFFKTFYQRLLSAGKLKNVALVAVMRKLACLLNHLQKNSHFCLAP